MNEKRRFERIENGWRLTLDSLSVDLPMTDSSDNPPYDAWSTPDLIAHFGEPMQIPIRYSVAPLVPPKSTTMIPLPSPTSPEPISFFAVLDQRRTLYQYGVPVRIDEIGMLLYHAARVKEMLHGALYDSSRRPYPSAGAAYELEIYILAAACDGLPVGFYHYGPREHVFELLLLPDAQRQMMIDDAIRQTANQINMVQIALYITARMRRINWKNRPLTLAHQDAGVLLQTFYLTATALGLAPCALGGVNAVQFSQWTGISASEEPLMSGFLIGSSKS